MQHAELTNLYEQFAPMVMRRARTILGNHEDAHDVMQDVFTRIAHKGIPNDAGLTSYFYVAATRTALTLLARNRRSIAYAGDDAFWSTFADVSTPELRNDIQRLLAKCDDKTRTAGLLVYADRYTLQEAAEALSLSLSGVRKRVRKFKAMASTMQLDLDQVAPAAQGDS